MSARPIIGRQRKAILLAWDVSWAVLALLFAHVLSGGSASVAGGALLLVLLPFGLYVGGLYNVILPSDSVAVAEQELIVGLLLGGPMLAAHVLLPAAFGSALANVWRLILVLAVVYAARAAARRLFRLDHRVKPVVVIGQGLASRKAADAVRNVPQLTLLGVFDSPAEWFRSVADSALDDALVVVATGHRAEVRDARDWGRLRRVGVEIVHLASLIEMVERRLPVSLLDVEEARTWFEFPPARDQASLRFKRVLDIIGALVLITILGPLALIGGLVMRVSTQGPMLYQQRRVGKAGRVFEIFKLRSMRVDAEAGTGAVWSSRNDPRITTVGAFLRKTRLDEVPQLWNVLTGSMSLVGPRPERPEFTDTLATKIPLFDLRHRVNPGLTGWAQVCYPYGSSVEDSERKLEYDLFYIKHWSIWFDVRVLLQTIRIVLLARGGR